MATLVTDDFESYSLAALNGQGSWSGATNFLVENSVVAHGTKAVKELTSTGTYISIQKVGSAISDGRQTIYMRLDAYPVSGSELQLSFLSGGSEILRIRVTVSGNIDYLDSGANAVVLGAFALNTWYPIIVEWRNSDKKVRYSIDGGNTFTDWVAPWNAFTTINRVQVGKSTFGGDTYGLYFDYLAENPAFNVFSRTLSDSIMNGASRTVPLSRTVYFTRGVSATIMNAASRLATISRNFVFMRTLSDSIMNGASRFSNLFRANPLNQWLNPNAQSYPKSKEQSYPKANEQHYPQSKNNSKEIK